MTKPTQDQSGEWISDKEWWNYPLIKPTDAQIGAVDWPAPTPEMLASPQFEAIWQCIKQWDINVPGVYSGYCGANGNHVRAILDALTAAAEVGDETFDAGYKYKEAECKDEIAATIQRCAQVAQRYLDAGHAENIPTAIRALG